MITDFKIYPVIEISPWNFEKGSEILDAYGDKIFKDKVLFERLRIEIFELHGIKNVKQIDKYAYNSIKVSDLNDNDLKALLKTELADYNLETELEEIASFEGGLVIEIEGQKAITHSCCGGIHNHIEWVEVLNEKPTIWTEVWIGHPWVYIKVDKDILQISDYKDETMKPPEAVDSAVKYEFHFNDFKMKIDKAVQELQLLKQRISRVLKADNYPFSNQIATVLIENKYISESESGKPS